MSYDMVQEKVPRFIKRIGDRVSEGSNNVLMILGTDRAAPGEAALDSGFGHINAQGGGTAAGAWHVVVGRSAENPNFSTDNGYMYVSMKTDVDKNSSLEDIEFNTNSVSGVMIKADSVRVIGRKDIKIHANKTYLTLNGVDTAVLESPKNIFLGTKAAHPIPLGDNLLARFNAFVDAFNNLVDKFNAHTHLGNSGAPTSKAIAPGGQGGSAIPNPAHPALLLPPPAGPGIPPSMANPVKLFVPGGSVGGATKMKQSDLSSFSKTK